MKNIEGWSPTKFLLKNNQLSPTADCTELAVGSRLAAKFVADFYSIHLRKHAKGRLLDLGCGKVPFYAAYKELVEEIVCVDWPNETHKGLHLDVECDLNQPLPFPDSGFDCILLSDVLEHLFRPERLCLEMARILRRGGKVMMNVPFYYWVHAGPHDYFRYTEFALRKFVEDSGFRVVEFESAGGVPVVLADILAKALAEMPRGGARLSILAQKIAEAFIDTSWGGRVAAQSRSEFPLMYFIVAEKV